MYLKKILAGLWSVALIGALCSCNSTQETNKTETNAILTNDTEETTLAVESTAETTSETTVAIETEVTNGVSENGIETTIAGEQADVTAPDAAFLLKLCNMWLSDDVLENGKRLSADMSPSGTVTALYADVDGDAVKEFCFCINLYESAILYVCEWRDTAWEVVDALNIAEMYTYLQTNDDGTTSLFAVVGVRAVEGLRSYVYTGGVEEEFEMFDYTAFYDADLAAASDDTEREKFYYEAIEAALAKYTNLTYLFDLPNVTDNLLYDVRFLGSDFVPDDFDSEAVQAKLDTFTTEVAALFH